MKNTNCPCGSNQLFSACCEPFIQGTKLPTSAAALLRSRYTAYTQSNIDYIQKTMRGARADAFDPQKAKKWASDVKWLGLELIKTSHKPLENIAWIQFNANYEEKSEKKQMSENAEFRFIDGKWFFIDGKYSSVSTTPKIGRNDPCSCGSQKKYKKCCGK